MSTNTPGFDNSLLTCLGWEYIGNTPYQKAYIIWSDEASVGPGKYAWIATHTAYDNLIKCLNNRVIDINWTDVHNILTADYLQGRVFAVDVDPNNGKHHIAHCNSQVTSTTGWGFSLLANVDEDGFITDYALNCISPREIKTDYNLIEEIILDDYDLTHIKRATPRVAIRHPHY